MRIAAGPIRARSSAEEHYLDMVGVTGSIPVAPTIMPRFFKHFWHHARADRLGPCDLIAFQRKQGPLAPLGQQTDDAVGRERHVGERVWVIRTHSGRWSREPSRTTWPSQRERCSRGTMQKACAPDRP